MSNNMPEFPELGGVGVLPRRPRVSENDPKHTVWKSDGFYPGGQGMRRAEAILGQHEAELAKIQFVLTRQSTTSKLPSRVASS